MNLGVESEEALAARRVGSSVGRYYLEGVLGVGGMAAVYRARATDGSLVAIKILHAEMSRRRDIRERFYREGYLANSIQHPGVVQVLEHGEDGEAFLAMELLVGETLTDRVRRHGALPLPELYEFSDQVLDVLRAAHDKGVVHRDLKPDNLFVTNAGQIKILDFGLARFAEGAPGDHRTRSGVALGTLPYMAPEQALGRRAEIDGRVDLFALGATLFRILAGRRVHEADSEAELLMAMASRPAPALHSVCPQVPHDFARIIDLALAFSRDARYPNAATMQADVRAVRAGLPPPYASERFAQRDQKTRTEPMADPPAPASLGPRGTVPLSAMPFAQTYPPVTPPQVPLVHYAPPPVPPTAPDGPVLGQTQPSAGARPAAPGAAPAKRAQRSWLVLAITVGGLLVAGFAAAGYFWFSARAPDAPPLALPAALTNAAPSPAVAGPVEPASSAQAATAAVGALPATPVRAGVAAKARSAAAAVAPTPASPEPSAVATNPASAAPAAPAAAAAAIAPTASSAAPGPAASNPQEPPATPAASASGGLPSPRGRGRHRR